MTNTISISISILINHHHHHAFLLRFLTKVSLHLCTIHSPIPLTHHIFFHIRISSISLYNKCTTTSHILTRFLARFLTRLLTTWRVYVLDICLLLQSTCFIFATCLCQCLLLLLLLLLLLTCIFPSFLWGGKGTFLLLDADGFSLHKCCCYWWLLLDWCCDCIVIDGDGRVCIRDGSGLLGLCFLCCVC
jgi:hypothetical protein